MRIALRQASRFAVGDSLNIARLALGTALESFKINAYITRLSFTIFYNFNSLAVRKIMKYAPKQFWTRLLLHSRLRTEDHIFGKR